MIKGIRTSQVNFTLLSHAQGQLSCCEARDPKGRGLYSKTIARGHVIGWKVHLTGPDYFSNTVGMPQNREKMTKTTEQDQACLDKFKSVCVRNENHRLNSAHGSDIKSDNTIGFLRFFCIFSCIISRISTKIKLTIADFLFCFLNVF